MLTAVDTNVLLRRLLRDDEEQLRIAKSVFEAGQIFIPATVMMEAEWVLRSYYKWKRQQISQAFRNIMQMPNAVVDASDDMLWVLDRYDEGADMADMMHLAHAIQADRLVTFDRDFVRVAANQSSIPVELLA